MTNVTQRKRLTQLRKINRAFYADSTRKDLAVSGRFLCSGEALAKVAYVTFRYVTLLIPLTGIWSFHCVRNFRFVSE